MANTLRDYFKFGISFAELIANQDGSLIVGISTINAMHCRLTQAEQGSIKNCVIHGNWPDSPAGAFKTLPVLDNYDPESDLISRRISGKTAGKSFDNLAPFIQSAEVNYILPLLGEELYNQLLSYYSTPGKLPAGVTVQNKSLFDLLVQHTQRALINLAYYAGYDFLNTIINDAGFHRQESDTEKGLYKYQEEAVKSGFRNNGFNALDTMLGFLESHIDDLPLFKTSSNYTLRKASLLPDTRTFDSIFDINNSRLVFLKICRFIKEVEDFEIGALLGDGLYSRLKEETFGCFIFAETYFERYAANSEPEFLSKFIACYYRDGPFKESGINCRAGLIARQASITQGSNLYVTE